MNMLHAHLWWKSMAAESHVRFFWGCKQLPLKLIPSPPSITWEIRWLIFLVCTRKLVNWPQLEQVKLIVPQNVTGDRSNRPGHNQVSHSWLVGHLGQSQWEKFWHMVLYVNILPCLQWRSPFRPVMLSVWQNRIAQNTIESFQLEGAYNDHMVHWCVLVALGNLRWHDVSESS